MKLKETKIKLTTWDIQTLIDAQKNCFRMLQDYASEPISQRTDYSKKFYKRIENDLKAIQEEIRNR